MQRSLALTAVVCARTARALLQLLSLPEIPYLFSQFFAGNIWVVTLVTGNPTNVLLAEDLGDSFVSFAARMGIPGSACAARHPHRRGAQ